MPPLTLPKGSLANAGSKSPTPSSAMGIVHAQMDAVTSTVKLDWMISAFQLTH